MITEDILEKKYTINDLPKFSEWPHRLLGLTPFEQRQKSHHELLREFEREKWGPILKAMQKNPANASIQTVNNYWYSERPKHELITVNKEIKASTPPQTRNLTLDTIKSLLLRYLPSESLVELGAGFGDMFIDIALDPAFENLDFFAGEFTKSGQKLLKIIAENEKLNCTIGQCDFNQNPMIDFTIPNQSIIYTVTATMYIPKLQDHFMEQLLQYNPKYVVHLEPCYEHLDESELLGSLCKKYFQLNDYNQNLVSLIKSYEQKGKIEILENKPSVIGPNPFLPLSVIVWRPKV